MATSTPAIKPAGKPEKRTSGSTSETSKDIVATILPYLFGMIVQLPLLVLYYFWLSDRPHYSSWFPFGILATLVLIYYRWPRDGRQIFMESMWSNVLLAVSVIAGLLGVLFVEPWFAACSVYTLLASLMARVIDRDTGRSLWSVALPLYVTLAIPMGWDQRLINWLQSSSAHLTSRLLDLANIAHYMPGTVIQVPGKEGGYGVEEACSGIQSFFLLLFVAIVLCVWLRRTVFRSILLVAAAVVWSIFMNCIRIFLIPIFDINFEVNLSEGVSHDLLGWSTMALGVLLLLSTDQFLMFLFGPVEAGTGSSGPMGKFITKVWNNLIAGKKDDEETTKRRKSKRQPLSALSKMLAWGTAGLLCVGGIWALWDIASCYQAPEHASLNFFSTKVVYPLKENSLPQEVDGWKQVKNSYRSSDRSRGSDFGEKSDSWVFMSPSRFFAEVSFDQAFPGWHELTTCYQNTGWKLKVRNKREFDMPGPNGETVSWPYIEAHFEKSTGEQGMLVFSLFDGFGEPFDPPKEWNAIAHLMHGATGRLGSRIRARLFQNSAYQSQIFVRGYGDISAEVRDEVTDRFLKIREQLRQEFIDARKAEDGGAATAVAMNE